MSKLKPWDGSKIDDDAPYDSKTMQDWIAVLQGHKVPNAEPNNQAFAEAVRYGILELHPKLKSKPNRRIYDFDRDGDVDEWNERNKHG